MATSEPHLTEQDSGNVKDLFEKAKDLGEYQKRVAAELVYKADKVALTYSKMAIGEKPSYLGIILVVASVIGDGVNNAKLRLFSFSPSIVITLLITGIFMLIAGLSIEAAILWFEKEDLREDQKRLREDAKALAESQKALQEQSKGLLGKALGR